MPELPEVEVVRSGLQPAVSGASISAVEVFDDRSLRRHTGDASDFIDRLLDRRVLLAARRGKFLWLPLGLRDVDAEARSAEARSAEARSAASRVSLAGSVEPRSAEPGSAEPHLSVPGSFEPRPSGPENHGMPEALVVHLGMSGQVLLRDRTTDDPRTRIRLEIEHPEHGSLRLNFVDQRLFGSMAIDSLVPAGDAAGDRVGELIPSQVAHISRDPMDPLFDDRAFFDRLSRRNSGIKRALLDQTLISGIGNIYADEALWAARIHYEQPASSLGPARAGRLLAEVRHVLAKALSEGGTSFDSQYVNVNGASGYFVHSLNAYGRQGKPCRRCGRPIVRESFMNRGSHFCRHCQRNR